MNKLIFVSVTLSLLINYHNSKAQDTTQKKNETLRKGQIINQENFTVAPFITVLNISTKKATASDQNGFFQIPAKEGDILVFPSVQFVNDTLVVNEPESFGKLLTVFLNPRTISLQEVTILDLPPEDKFKRNILAYEPKPEEKTNFNFPQFMTPIMKNPSTKAPSFTEIIGSPITGLYKKFSRKEKEKRAMARINQSAPQQRLIDSKFNRTLVKNLTSFKGNQLDRF
ncbi:hypothetical protein, partial [Xanthovirga aplysinae]|uniref:hypothetical protein n=1 Tax=Xanthovirga aplysinae TaxID=2529853 RepID=UPI0012BCBE07